MAVGIVVSTSGKYFGFNIVLNSIPLPDSYLPVLVDGMTWLAESIDDEHVNSQRAKMFMDSSRIYRDRELHPTVTHDYLLP